ncbi:hypothetical protein D3C85_1839790 [compost metagenome]
MFAMANEPSFTFDYQWNATIRIVRFRELKLHIWWSALLADEKANFPTSRLLN